MGQYEEKLAFLGEAVKLVLATADAFCQVWRAIFLWRRLATLAQ